MISRRLFVETRRPGIPGGGRAPALRGLLGGIGGGLAVALAVAGCGDTLVDHDGRGFVGGQACAGTPVSCGAGPACVDCTVSSTPPANAQAVCGASATCDYQCNPGWLRCGSGCCQALSVATGANHTCAILGKVGDTSGQLKCWGANDRGQLGVGVLDTQDRLVPTDVVGMNSGVTVVAAGAAHTCAIKGGALYCWGANGDPGLVDYRLGVTTGLYQYETPQTVALSGASAIAPGERHTCALATGGIYCWGANDRGQLGSATVPPGSPRSGPPAAAILPSASAVASGRSHGCALVGGAVWCWGANDWGQLGNGVTVPGLDAQTPVQAGIGTLTAVTAITAGDHHGCAINGPTSPLLYCWGENTAGQLGTNPGAATATPTVATAAPSTPFTAAAGSAHTCAAKADLNGIKCFGSNALGQLGGPGATAVKMDVLIGKAATALAAGGDHACALAADGSLFCWGANSRGQVGDGTTSATGVFNPTLVSGR